MPIKKTKTTKPKTTAPQTNASKEHKSAGWKMKLKKTRQMPNEDLAGIQMLQRVWRRLQGESRLAGNKNRGLWKIEVYVESCSLVHKIEDKLRRGDYELKNCRYPSSMTANPKLMRKHKILLPAISSGVEI